MQDPWEQSLSTLLQDAKAENGDFGVRVWHFKSENAKTFDLRLFLWGQEGGISKGLGDASEAHKIPQRRSGTQSMENAKKNF